MFFFPMLFLMHDQSLNFKNRVTSDIQLKAQNIFAEPLLEVLNDIDIIKRENHISKKVVMYCIICIG